MFNWKTTVLGLAAIVSVAANYFALGVTPSLNEIGTIFAAFGLIAAKDAK